VYTDRDLTIAMAVPLIGVQSERLVEHDQTAGFNWLVQARIGRGESSSVMQDIRELLPEELAHAVFDAIPDERKELSVKDAVAMLSATGEARVLPGRPMSITGLLHINELVELSKFDPFDPPPIDLKTFNFHGETCFAAELQGDNYRLPVYFGDASRAQVAYCHTNPVELTGVLRWCPPYSPRGAASLQLALRVAAVWLV
jgi:hypothetical protein